MPTDASVPRVRLGTRLLECATSVFSSFTAVFGRLSPGSTPQQARVATRSTLAAGKGGCGCSAVGCSAQETTGTMTRSALSHAF